MLALAIAWPTLAQQVGGGLVLLGLGVFFAGFVLALIIYAGPIWLASAPAWLAGAPAWSGIAIALMGGVMAVFGGVTYVVGKGQELRSSPPAIERQEPNYGNIEAPKTVPKGMSGEVKGTKVEPTTQVRRPKETTAPVWGKLGGQPAPELLERTMATPTATASPETSTPTPRTKSVSDVDWRNTQYTTDCQGLAAQPFTVDIQNGEGNGPADDTYYNGYIVKIEAVATGDLTADGRPETAVLLYCSPQPSNFFVQEVQTFTDGRGDPQLLDELPEVYPLADGLDLPPVFDSERFLIDSGQLVTGVDYYSASDSHASGPSIHRVLTWQWDGSRFVAKQGQASSSVAVKKQQ